MQVELEKSLFQEALETAFKSVSAKSPLPILSHLLVKATPDTLQVTGTDLDLGIRVSIPCKTAQEGACAVPAALVRDIVSKLPAGPVALIGTEARLTLRAARSKFEVCTLPAEEYPALRTPEGATLSLPQKALKDLIRLVMPAVAKSDESRAVMTGVKVELDGGHLILCATDGRRLAWARAEASTDEKQTAIIPGRTMTEIARACGDTQDPLTVVLDSDNLWVTKGSLHLYSRLLCGNFPDYQRVLPTEFQRTARVDRAALVGAIKRLLLVAQERQSPNLLVFDFAELGEGLRLSANTPDLGLGEEDVPGTLEGAPLKIAFNGKYILDALSVMTCEECHWDLQDDTRSAVVHEGDPNFRYVAMPVRLREAVPEEVATDEDH